MKCTLLHQQGWSLGTATAIDCSLAGLQAQTMAAYGDGSTQNMFGAGGGFMPRQALLIWGPTPLLYAFQHTKPEQVLRYAQPEPERRHIAISAASERLAPPAVQLKRDSTAPQGKGANDRTAAQKSATGRAETLRSITVKQLADVRRPLEAVFACLIGHLPIAMPRYRCCGLRRYLNCSTCVVYSWARRAACALRAGPERRSG